MALGGRRRTSHWWESTSTAQEAKLDTRTCSTQDLVAQHVPAVTLVQLLPPEDLCPMDHVNSDIADSGRFLVEKITSFGGPLYFAFTPRHYEYAEDASNTEGSTA